MKKLTVILIFLMATLYQCQEKPVYPDVPLIYYENFYLYISTNNLEQEVLMGKLNFSFTDGDGNLGLYTPTDTSGFNLPDTQRYNLFMQLHDYQDNEFVRIPEEDGGYLKYIIPYLDKKPLSGTVSVTIEYPIITYDTIFYTFFIYDRDLNKSNTDTTDVLILSGIELNN
ncbi:MAG: hypothetical protein WD052_04040 [Bacteroidales bacterium]